MMPMVWNATHARTHSLFLGLCMHPTLPSCIRALMYRYKMMIRKIAGKFVAFGQLFTIFHYEFFSLSKGSADDLY